MSFDLKRIVLAAALSFGSLAAHAQAATPVTDGGTYSWLQNVQGAINAQTNAQVPVLQEQKILLNQQLEQLQGLLVDADKAGAQLTDTQKAQIVESLTRIVDEAKKVSGLSFLAADVDQAFKEKYPGYDTEFLTSLADKSTADQAAAFADRAKTSGESLQKSVVQALQFAGAQVADIQSDATLLAAFRDLSDSSDGALKALQAGNRINAMTAQSLLSLRTSMLRMSDMQANFIAWQKSNVERTQMELATDGAAVKVGRELSASTQKKAKETGSGFGLLTEVKCLKGECSAGGSGSTGGGSGGAPGGAVPCPGGDNTTYPGFCVYTPKK